MRGERATPRPLTWQVTWVAETGSTNADLVAAARAGAPAGTVLAADHQTAGRGRLGRRWQAPPGTSLLVSILLAADQAADLAGGHLQRLTQAAALAAADACAEVAGVTVALKWPNDLLLDDRKLAGVLAESVVEGGRVVAVVVGIGLNVRRPDDVPPDLAASAAYLSEACGHDVDRHQLLDSLLAHLAATDWPGLETAYRARLATLGRQVRVISGDAELVGRAVDVTASGELVVEAPDRRCHTVNVGDITHLRHV